MKRVFKQLSVVFVALIMLFVTACGGGGGNGAGNEPGNEQGNGNQGQTEIGPLTKYDPPITIRGTLTDTARDYLDEGQTLEDNAWTRGYEEELGIKVTYDWIVDSSSAAEKMNVTLVGGDLPDLLVVNQTQFKQLLEADAVEDLTEVYEQYASDLLKEFYNDGADGLRPVRVDDRLMGLTDYSGSYDAAPMVWIRTDWLNNLGLEPPKSMDDLIEIARAFTFDDPDGNGRNDTYGIGLNKDLDNNWSLKLDGFMNAYGAFTDVWIKDEETGKLVYGSIQPEVKDALAALQELFAEKVIDQEFATKDVNQAAESLMAGRGGIFFGPMASPFLISGMVRDGSDADWMPYPIPSVDGGPATTYNRIQNTVVFAVRKGYEHPEALIKMLNFSVEKLYGENAEYNKYMMESSQGFHAAPVKLLKPNKNQVLYQGIVRALESGDTSELDQEGLTNYNGILQYREGDKSQWWYERIFGPESSQAVVEYYINNNLMITDQFVYPPTATMGTRQASLDKMMMETFTKIIYGESSIDEFDTFVQNWKNLGGDQITEEVNELAGL